MSRQPSFFTLDEVSDRLQVSTRTVRRWIAAGELKAHRLGRVVRISDEDLRVFLALRRSG